GAALTVVASAFIAADGTIIAQDGSWVSSVFVASDGLYELILNSSIFANRPNGVANLQSIGVPAFANAVSSGAPNFLYGATWKSGNPPPRSLRPHLRGVWLQTRAANRHAATATPATVPSPRRELLSLVCGDPAGRIFRNSRRARILEASRPVNVL